MTKCDTICIFLILIHFIVLYMVADGRMCDEWHKVQVAVWREWHGDLNVITQPSHTGIDLQLLFSDYSGRRVNETINVNNKLLNIDLLADYDEFGGPILNSIMINGVNICDKFGGSVLEFKAQEFQSKSTPPINSILAVPPKERNHETYALPDECGIVIPGITPYIHHGNRATVSEFPWQAVIFNVPEYKYQCGGSLMSHNLIVIAAHCVTESKTRYQLPESSIIAIPGFGFNENWDLPDQLASIKMPVVSYERCLSSHRDFYAHVISETNFCAGSLNGSSVCNGDSGGGMVFKINSLYYLRGIVSIGPANVPGFGFNENWNLPDQLASIKMPVVSYERCLLSHRDFYAHVISETNFCAGSLNGSSVCKGDSGGGMVFKINSLYYLRGIVSIGPANVNDRTRCTTKYYIVFTDVAKYVDWLQKF